MQLLQQKLRELDEAAYQIRRLSVEMITYGRWGHIGGSFSMAEILAVLYFQVMRLIRTAGLGGPRPAGPLQSARLARPCMPRWRCAGSSRSNRSTPIASWAGFEGHTDMTRTPGLESSGGPLGMGLSVAVGMALAMRFKENARWRVFCILGDGETNEGNVWEAAMAAAHYHLDNLIAIVDYNKVMAKGFVWD